MLGLQPDVATEGRNVSALLSIVTELIGSGCSDLDRPRVVLYGCTYIEAMAKWCRIPNVLRTEQI